MTRKPPPPRVSADDITREQALKRLNTALARDLKGESTKNLKSYYVEHEGRKINLKWATGQVLGGYPGHTHRCARVMRDLGFRVVQVAAEGPEEYAAHSTSSTRSAAVDAKAPRPAAFPVSTVTVPSPTVEPDPLPELRQAFQRFRDNPVERFRLTISRRQVQKMRGLLADVERIDLDTFNREIWQIESRTCVRGEDVGRIMTVPEDQVRSRLRDLQHALDAGELELHGNSIWGSATRVFAPMLKDDDEKLENIRRAATILNDTTMPPLQKAVALLRIKGFGPNIATGLVMAFHPSEFAIYNGPSREALRQLGYDEATLQSFESSVRALKEQLGAEDLLELDRFLYLQREPRPAQVWLFQAVPETYNLSEALRTAQVGDQDEWLVTRYADSIQSGDIVLLWQGGPEAGIYAVGEITGQAFERPQSRWRSAESSDETTELAIPFRYTQILANPIRKTALAENPALRDLQVLRVTQDTNFKVTSEEWEALQPYLTKSPAASATSYVEPEFDNILASLLDQGMQVDERTIRRYHLSLKVRGFVILSGVSGTGKTWLTEGYARAVGARYRLVAVAPNWNTNEDLLGYYNPLDGVYHDTDFSRFLRAAAAEYQRASTPGRTPKPFHLTLDEMNLARVEYYFAKFLSAMEARARDGIAAIELGNGDNLLLPPNLYFMGTVNVDETTHGFADKVYDRAQLLEMPTSRQALDAYLSDAPYREVLLETWDAVSAVAPFAFRVMHDIRKYVDEAALLDQPWDEAMDEQILQKVLPKLARTDPAVGDALSRLIMLAERYDFTLSRAKAEAMLEGFQHYVG